MLDSAQIAQLFPFFILISEDLRILEFGSAIARAQPDMRAGDLFETQFKSSKPLADLFPFDEARQKQISDKMISIDLLSSGMSLSGQFTKAGAVEDKVFFLGSPTINNLNALKEYNLSLRDFPPHNAISDMLFMLQAREASLADSRVLLERLRDSRNEALKLSQVAARTKNMVVVTSPYGEIEWVNAAFETLTGYTSAESIGKRPGDLLQGPNSDPQVIAHMHDCLERGEGFNVEIINYSKSGEEYWVQIEVQPVLSDDGNLLNFMAVETDVTERREFADALRRARDEAEAANRAKSDFLANMSHEIRTPLNGILGVASILSDMQMNTQQQEYLDIIRRSGDSLLTIINDILDFSKIEANKLELEVQPFDLRKCIEDALDLFSSAASKKGIDLAYLIAPNVPSRLIGDETRLRQVLVNLVSNAVKFTQKGEVVVEVNGAVFEADDQQFNAMFSIKDTGIGMDAEEQERLFKAFSQVDASMTRKYGGTGLGLAICKRLCELMHGDISVESEKGVGTMFHFSVRLGIDADAPAESWENDRDSLRGHSVLIVDDNTTNRIILMQFLENWGVNVRSASNGIEALYHLKQDNAIELAILDVQMPEMDGIALAREVTTLRPNLPMIVFSSVGYRDRQFEAMNVTGYLNKPLRPRELHRLLLENFSPSDLPKTTVEASALFDHEMGERVKLSILIAEDNTVNQHVAVGILRRLGYQSDVVGNGLEVLDALRLRKYDVILMDIQMPEMDGVEATKRIMQNYPEGERPYIIALTAHALQGYREQYLAAGMQDYISKPIVVKELRAALERAGAQRNVPLIDSEIANKTPKIDAYTQINMTYLQEIFGEDAELMLSDLMPMFLEEAVTELTKMQLNAANQNWDGIRISAHTLKSASASVGLTKFSELCQQLETVATSDTPHSCHALIQQANASFAAAQAEWSARN